MDIGIWRNFFEAGRPMVKKDIKIMDKPTYLSSRILSSAGEKYAALIIFHICWP